MSLRRDKLTGLYSADFRYEKSGIPRLHLSLVTKNRKVAERRHEAVEKLFKQRRVELIEQLRSGDLTVERLESMVEHHEPLTPVAVAKSHSWGTVDACADRYIGWLEDHPNRRKGTAQSARQSLQWFRDFTVNGERIGDLDLDAVTPEMIGAYQRSHVDAKRPVNSITLAMMRVGALWRFVRKQEERLAQQERRAPRPVYSPVDPDMVLRDHKRRERFLTEAELAKLFEATPPSARFAVYCGAMAGLRADEMLHLRAGIDVDLEMGAVTVRDQEGWKPKTKRSRRTIPMAAALRSAANAHILNGNARHGWMMPGFKTPEKPMTKTGWQQTFQAIVERAGLVYGTKQAHGVTFHTLRHTFASHAVMRGVDLYTVAQLLGDSLQMIESTYAHLSPDHKKAAIAKLEPVFRVTQPATQKTRKEAP